MKVNDTLIEMREGRKRFLALLEDLRPDLHRYCARMTGSIADGEDVVQQTLARAYYVLPELDDMPPLRPWLFRIAYTTSLDHLRRYEHRMSERLEEGAPIEAGGLSPEDALARQEAMKAALTRFVELPPTQRGVTILKDILGHSLTEIAEMLELSVTAVKSALHRGREGLRRSSVPVRARRRPSEVVARYVALFNERDWDGVRALLADDVKLDVVSRHQRTGRTAVGSYFGNYDKTPGWCMRTGWLDGEEVVAAFWNDEPKPRYFIQLVDDGGHVTGIRDFIHVPYVLRDAEVELSTAAEVKR